MRTGAALALLATLLVPSLARAVCRAEPGETPAASAEADQAPPDPPQQVEPPPPATLGQTPGAAPHEAPILTGSSDTVAPPERDLLVFHGAVLFNEFVYRSVIKLPHDAKATKHTLREVTRQLAAFMHDAGYDLAKVRARVVGDQIDVTIDEGALDKIIFTGAGWLTALRFRTALDMPLDVFNRKLFERQMPLLARKFGLRGYRYELWPVHLLDADNAAALEDVDELRAMPLLQPARGYELRIFADTDPWSVGFSPEVVLNGEIGVGLGGRYRLRDLFTIGDRWQAHFRTGGAIRGHLDPAPVVDGPQPAAPPARLVNTNDYLTTRWLSRPWGGSPFGLRFTVNPRAELWMLQRADLHLDQYRVGWVELAAGAGAQLSHELSLYLTTGLQRRWLGGLTWAPGYAPEPDVVKVPATENRLLLSATTQYTFNPEALRADSHNTLSLDLDAYQPTTGGTGFFRFNAMATRNFEYGWNELRTRVALAGEVGGVEFVDEIPLDEFLRIGFGLQTYTERIASTRLEFRYSLIRDKVKIGPFTDLGVWRQLPRVDPKRSPELSGSSGGGVFLFVFDELQVDAYYGVGWTTNGSVRPGLNLQVKEAF